MGITNLEIDTHNDVLRINGKRITDRPVIVTFHEKGKKYPYGKLFNVEQATGKYESYDRLELEYRMDTLSGEEENEMENVDKLISELAEHIRSVISLGETEEGELAEKTVALAELIKARNMCL